MIFNQKENLRRIAEETVKNLNDGFYVYGRGFRVDIAADIKKCNEQTKLITEFNNLTKGQPNINIDISPNTTVLEIMNQTKERPDAKIIALNFASAKHPGGGFLRGSIAQEESLARVSSLYSSLITKREMYEANEREHNPLYLDTMIFSPDVVFFRDDRNNYVKEPYHCSILTSAAVNKGYALDRNMSEEKINNAMRNRIHKIINLCLSYEPDIIILGAYGCGVFKNNPTDVSRMFKDALDSVSGKEETSRSVDIVFAIPDANGENYKKFSKTLLKRKDSE